MKTIWKILIRKTVDKCGCRPNKKDEVNETLKTTKKQNGKKQRKPAKLFTYKGEK